MAAQGWSYRDTSSSFSQNDPPSIRELIRQHRGAVINMLEEKMTPSLLHILLLATVITAAEEDKVKKKQKRRQKASCLVDIVAAKEETKLKIFVDNLRLHCPDAYTILHIDGPEVDHGKATQQKVSESVDRNHQQATSELQVVMTDTHYGGYKFFARLKSIIKSGIDMASITFRNGMSLMHELINLGKEEYLKYIEYSGVWGQLYYLPAGRESHLYSNMIPLEQAIEQKNVKVQEILKRTNQTESSMTEIERYVREGNMTKFRELKENNPNMIVMKSQSGTCTLLDYACQSGNLAMLTEVILIEEEQHYRRSSVEDAVILCVELGHYNLLQPLMAYKPFNLQQSVVGKMTLSELAAESGDIKTFRELTKLGAHPTSSVIAIASQSNRLPFLKQILGEHPCSYDINFKDKRSKSAAHFAAEKGHADVLQLLLDKGLDITLKDRRNYSILHSCCNGNSLAVVNVILNYSRQQNYLHSMLSGKDLYLGKERCYLVKGKDKRRPAWHYVEVDRGLLEIFQRKIREGNVNVTDYGKIIESGWGVEPDVDVVKKVEMSYDSLHIKSTATSDMQPLHVAILKNHEEVALKLISVMGDVDPPDKFGLTPLHLAAMRGSLKVIDALLEKGVNVSSVDSKRRTALDLAVVNGHSEVVKRLTGAPQRKNREELRAKLFRAVDNLSEEVLTSGGRDEQDQKRFITKILRDTVADINDYLFDSHNVGPIAAECGH